MNEDFNLLFKQWDEEQRPIEKRKLENQLIFNAYNNGLNIKNRQDLIDLKHEIEIYDNNKQRVEIFFKPDEYFKNVNNSQALLGFLPSPGLGILFGFSGYGKSSFIYFLAKMMAIKQYRNELVNHLKLPDNKEKNYKILIIQLEESREVTRNRFSDVINSDK